MSKTKQITISALFTAVIAVLAQIQIPIQPIPFSLTLFAVFLTGAVLPPKCAFGATICYLILGGIGIPIFAGFQGGVGILFGPTGGYKLSYPIMALIISGAIYFYRKKINKERKPILAIIMIGGMLASLIVCYLFGTVWFMMVSNQKFIYALKVCVLPFIPFDILKTALASVSAVSILSIFKRNNLAQI